MSSGVIACTRSRKVADLLERQLVEDVVDHLRRDVVRRLDRQREAARQVRLRVRQLALEHALPLQPRELLDHQPQRLAGRVGPGVGFGDEVAGLLAAFGVRRRAVGQPALRAQHAVQPVGPFAAEHLDRQIPGQVVGMLPRDRQLTDADLGLHRVGLVDDDDAPRRRRRSMAAPGRHLAARPAPEHAFGRRERLLAA